MIEEVQDSDLEDNNADCSPRKTVTLFSCRPDNGGDPNAGHTVRKNYLQVFSQTVFLLYADCFTQPASD